MYRIMDITVGQSNIRAPLLRPSRKYKRRAARRRGQGSKRRGLDGAEHSGMIKRVMAADRTHPDRPTEAALCRSHRQVVVLAQGRLPEIAEESIQAIQRHCWRRGDFDSDRLSILPVIDHEQTVG
jgi:hypothetical protein